ncbi:MAG: hypothetical protein WC584_04290 [Candidatus Pacearchaeota archaeon]
MKHEISINLIKELLDKETRNYLIMRQICMERIKRISIILRESIIDGDRLSLELQKYHRTKERYSRISGEENSFSEADEYIGMRMRLTN